MKTRGQYIIFVLNLKRETKANSHIRKANMFYQIINQIYKANNTLASQENIRIRNLGARKEQMTVEDDAIQRVREVQEITKNTRESHK